MNPELQKIADAISKRAAYEPDIVDTIFNLTKKIYGRQLTTNNSTAYNYKKLSELLNKPIKYDAADILFFNKKLHLIDFKHHCIQSDYDHLLNKKIDSSLSTLRNKVFSLVDRLDEKLFEKEFIIVEDTTWPEKAVQVTSGIMENLSYPENNDISKYKHDRIKVVPWTDLSFPYKFATLTKLGGLTT